MERCAKSRFVFPLSSRGRLLMVVAPCGPRKGGENVIDKNKIKAALTIMGLAALIVIPILTLPLLYKYTLPTSGVQVEYGLSANPDIIDWGNCGLNEKVNRSVILTNTGSKDFMNLNQTYGNPSINLVNYNVTWDAEGFSLAIGETLKVNFTLIINEFNSATGNIFTFDIYIGEQA